MTFSPVRAAGTVRGAAMVAHADFWTIYTWRSWSFAWLVRLLCQVVFFALVGVLVGDPEYTSFIIVGAAMMVCVTETMLTSSSTCWERMQGRMPLIAASPVEPVLLFFGRSVFWPVSAAVTTSVALLAVPPFFGDPWDLWKIPVVIVVAALTALSTYCLALVVGALALSFTEVRNIASTVMTLYTTAFSGAMVPLDFWPPVLQWIAQALPVTHGLDAVRALQDGDLGTVAAASGLMLAVGAVWFVVATLAFRRVLARARKGRGGLD